MGRLKKKGGLHRRWMKNAAVIAVSLGLICLAVITTFYAVTSYSGLKTDLYERARVTMSFFEEYLNREYDEYYAICESYAENADQKDGVRIQFLSANGLMLASSEAGTTPGTPEIIQAVTTRGICTFVGNDGERRVIAVSAPVIYHTGEVIGVLRYVLPTAKTDLSILRMALLSAAAISAIGALLVLLGGMYVLDVAKSLKHLIQVSGTITAGGYGIQVSAKYDDEVGELAQTINEMSMKINQNEKMQTEFISNLSHELRTPLTAITGWSETLLTSDKIDEDTRKGAGIILREANRLTEMVVDLLDFTRMQDGRMTLNVEKTDIRSEFEDTVYMYGSRLRQEGITLNYQDTDEEIPEISCDPKRMRQVFLNLLNNAAIHGGEGKRIDASIAVEDGFVTVRIRDYGPGIPEDELPLVKKKFYKGSSKSRGSGIGLAVCEEIVQLHGGTLELTGAPGGGTLVTVCLAIS